MTRAFDSIQAMEAWAREHGWPVDRPWVKQHGGICACWRCVPHEIHDPPRFTMVREEYRYPCGRLVATAPGSGARDLLEGCQHYRGYFDPSTPVTCAGCLEARVKTFARTTQGRNAHDDAR